MTIYIHTEMISFKKTTHFLFLTFVKKDGTQVGRGVPVLLDVQVERALVRVV